MSHGMLLCASNEDHTVVTPLSPPAGVAVGELITFEGHAAAPEPSGNRAGKAFDRVADDLFAGEVRFYLNIYLLLFLSCFLVIFCLCDGNERVWRCRSRQGMGRARLLISSRMISWCVFF